MKIYGTVGRLIDRYGMDILVDNARAKAFIQPLRYYGRYYGTTERKKAGAVTSERFLYIGKPETRLICDKSVIQTEDSKYIVRRCDIYRMGERGVYTYAVLAPCGEVLEDEYESDNCTA
ncbi:MAG: hypothetical protein ACI4FO_05150 [Acutalibacteraceae bacterium]